MYGGDAPTAKSNGEDRDRIAAGMRAPERVNIHSEFALRANPVGFRPCLHIMYAKSGANHHSRQSRDHLTYSVSLTPYLNLICTLFTPNQAESRSRGSHSSGPKRRSKSGQSPAQSPHIWSNTGQMLVKNWSNTGQILVKYWTPNKALQSD